jgi:ribosomal protein S18 acetylase RimI-like enzyme
MIDIRTAELEDISTIQQLASMTWAEAYKDILSLEQMQYMLDKFYSTASLQQQMLEQQHQFIVALDEEEAVAFASYSPKSKAEPTIYRLHKIYIHPNQQGKGTGKTLLAYIFDTITSHNATALELNVNRHNPALHFYTKMGFHIIKEEDIDIGNGYWMNDYVMRKELAN